MAHVWLLLALLLDVIIVVVANPPRVLMVCIGSRSRIQPMAALARELHEAGTVQVTMALPAVASSWPEVKRSGADIFPVDPGEGGDIGTGGGSEQATASVYDGLIQRAAQALGVWEYAEEVERDVWRSQALYEPLVENFGDEETKPALMIVDSYTFAGFDAAHQLGLPYVVYHPGFLDAPPFARAYVPAHGTGYSINMRPWERCVNFLVPYLQHLALRPSLRSLNALRAERKLKPVSFHFDLWGAQNLFIATSAFGLEYARPLPATVELVGPVQQVGSESCSCPEETIGGSSAELPEDDEGGGATSTEADVEEWLRFADEDVLLLSGLAFVNAAQLEVLAEALKSLKRPVLWTGSVARRLKARSPNFRKFAPEPAGETAEEPDSATSCHSRFLAHPAITLVFSHCDVNQVHGAVLAGKPSVCLPSTSSQLDAATRLTDAGAAVLVPIGSGRGGTSVVSDAPAIRMAVEEAIAHLPRATRAVRYLSHTMSTAGGVQRAAQLVDTALELGMAHLRPMPMPWYTHTCLDLYCAFACVIVAFLLSLRLLVLLWSLLGRVC